MNDRSTRSIRYRLIIGVLLLLLLLLQVRLWNPAGGFSEVSRLRAQVKFQARENKQLAERNKRLEAEVKDLQRGFGAVEERARNDLGLIGENETFYVLSEEPDAEKKLK